MIEIGNFIHALIYFDLVYYINAPFSCGRNFENQNISQTKSRNNGDKVLHKETDTQKETTTTIITTTIATPDERSLFELKKFTTNRNNTER